MPPPILPPSAPPDIRFIALPHPHPPDFMMPGEEDGAHAAGEGGRRLVLDRNREKASATIDIEKYRHGIDDFEEWVDMLETAITLATNARDAHRDSLCLKWLPLKLDAASRAIYKQVDRALNWTEMKAELKKLLIDPQEAYKW